MNCSDTSETVCRRSMNLYHIILQYTHPTHFTHLHITTYVHLPTHLQTPTHPTLTHLCTPPHSHPPMYPPTLTHLRTPPHTHLCTPTTTTPTHTYIHPHPPTLTYLCTPPPTHTWYWLLNTSGTLWKKMISQNRRAKSVEKVLPSACTPLLQPSSVL